MNFNRIFEKQPQPKSMKQEGSLFVEEVKPINRENSLKSEEKIKYELNQRYADALLNLSGQKLLDEVLAISNEYKNARMFKEARETLLKAEEIENGKIFEQQSDKELDIIAGAHAKTVRELTEQINIQDRQN